MDIVELLCNDEKSVMINGQAKLVNWVAADEIERLRESLRFYADETNYKPKKVFTTSMPQYEPDGYNMVIPVRVDKGTRAKAALAKATGGE